MVSNLRTELVLGARGVGAAPAPVARESSTTPSRVVSTHRWPWADPAAKLACCPPMGKAGDCFANAIAESFFVSPERELLPGTPFRHPRHTREGPLPPYRGLVQPASSVVPASDIVHPSTPRKAIE